MTLRFKSEDEAREWLRNIKAAGAQDTKPKSLSIDEFIAEPEPEATPVQDATPPPLDPPKQPEPPEPVTRNELTDDEVDALLREAARVAREKEQRAEARSNGWKMLLTLGPGFIASIAALIWAFGIHDAHLAMGWIGTIVILGPLLILGPFFVVTGIILIVTLPFRGRVGNGKVLGMSGWQAGAAIALGAAALSNRK